MAPVIQGAKRPDDVGDVAPQCLVAEQPKQCLREIAGVAPYHQPRPGVGDVAMHGHLIGHDHREACGHSLRHRDAEILGVGGECEDIRGRQRGPLVVAGEKAGPGHVGGDAEHLGVGLDPGHEVGCSVAGDDERRLRHVPPNIGE